MTGSPNGRRVCDAIADDVDVAKDCGIHTYIYAYTVPLTARLCVSFYAENISVIRALLLSIRHATQHTRH